MLKVESIKKQTVEIKEQGDIRELSVEQFLSKLFNKYDVNSDGRLSKFEFAKTLKCLTRLTGAAYPKKPDVEDIFCYLDKDGDQTISRQQFSKLTQSILPLINLSGVKILCKSNS